MAASTEISNPRPVSGVIRRRVAPGTTAWFFGRDRLAMASLALIVLLILAAVLAPVLTPYADQGRGAPLVAEAYQAPSFTHPLGTDSLGRDLLARILFGLRTSLLLGFFVVALGGLFGTVLGTIAGYTRGWVDEVIMRVTDIVLSFPSLLLVIVISAVLRPSFFHAMLAITLTWWPWYVRLARSQAIGIRERYYVLAAQSMGASRWWIMARHIVPNILGPIRVQATFDFGAAILAGASLSFLGLGTQPPTPDLGVMVADGRTYLLTGDWWISVFPGFGIFLLVVAFILLGDGLQTVSNPRLRGVRE